MQYIAGARLFQLVSAAADFAGSDLVETRLAGFPTASQEDGASPVSTVGIAA
jgi:hypothetical protein